MPKVPDSVPFKDQQSDKGKKDGKKELQAYEIEVAVIESVYGSKLLLSHDSRMPS